ncbi:MAG: TetR/AcrR family transcriptional regulator [Candidatus Azobacteroides sp.]|nr:TetR/AcrR family transcriptional regulator [Candidatus Azobacteroides sp.]
MFALTILLNSIIKLMSETKINTEQSILNAAEAIFLTKGYAGTKTTEIAEKAGVNHAMLHYYFRTKESLFNKIFENKMHLFISSFFTAFDTDLPFKEKVRIAVEKHYDFIAANPRLPMFIMGEMLINDKKKEEVRKILIPKLLSILENLQTEIDKEVEKGTIPSSLSMDTMLNVVSLNIFSVLFTQITSIDNKYLGLVDMDVFMEQRKRNNISLILKGLGFEE